MRIALVSGTNPFSKKPGGTKTFVRNLAKTLSNKGHDVTIICQNDKAIDEKPNFIIEGIEVRKMGATIPYIASLAVQAKRAQFHQFDIIHFQRPDVALPFVNFRKSMMVSLHGNEHFTFRRAGKRYSEALYTLAEIPGLLACRRVISTDRLTAEYYSQMYPFVSKKITIIPMGVDLEIFRPHERDKARMACGLPLDCPIVLYAGRLSVEKDLTTLIKAFSILKVDHLTARLIIVGHGKEKTRLKALISELGLLDDVSMNDPVGPEKLALLMSSSNVFALSSLTESSPTVVREALACGTPVVSFDVGDVRDLVKDGETGALVRQRDPKAFADGLSNTILDSTKFRHKCIRATDQYSWDNIGGKILEIYYESQN